VLFAAALHSLFMCAFTDIQKEACEARVKGLSYVIDGISGVTA